MNLTEAFKALKFCPFCGKELTHHPLSGAKACFMHGDFKVEGDDEHATIEFIPVRLKRSWRSSYENTN